MREIWHFISCDNCGAESGLVPAANEARPEAVYQGWKHVPRRTVVHEDQSIETIPGKDLCPQCI